jgi:hypothetical protein
MEKERYIVIDIENDNSLTHIEVNDEELAEYVEESWNREESPNIIIPVSDIEKVLKTKPETYEELFANRW